VYTFTKLHDSVHEYGGKMKFGAKNEESINTVNRKMWHFATYCKIKR